MTALRIPAIGAAALCVLIAGCTVGPTTSGLLRLLPPAFKEHASASYSKWNMEAGQPQATRRCAANGGRSTTTRN